MQIASMLNQAVRYFGYEVVRYDPAHSSHARLFALLRSHQIDSVLDVGANSGGYGTELRKGGYSGNILSFEPLIESHKCLLKAAKQDRKWFIANRMAIGDRIGEVDINISKNLFSSSILPMNSRHQESAQESYYIGKQKTPICRLDSVDLSILGASTRMFLKVDTQGFEMSVLLGSEGIIGKIHGLQIELSLVELYEGEILYREMIEWLTKRGFNLWNIIPGFSDAETGQMLQMDGVFFRS